jgi:hypothetical protein
MGAYISWLDSLSDKQKVGGSSPPAPTKKRKESVMLTIDIKTQSKQIATIKVICKLKNRHAGEFTYDVNYTKGKMVLNFTVKHIRLEGMAKLLMILAKKIQRETKKFYRIPKDKIVKQGKTKLIKMDDIPANYRDRFASWMNGQTGTMIRGKMAVYLDDLERWVDWEVAGVTPFFD